MTRRRLLHLAVSTLVVCTSVTGVVACGIAPAGVGSALNGQQQSTPPAPDTAAACSAGQVQPFGCAVYRISAPSVASAELQGWFDVLAGEPRFVIAMSEQLHVIPVLLEDGRAFTATGGAWASIDRDCPADSECALGQLLAETFVDSTVLTRTSDGLVVEGAEVRFDDTATVHRYVDVAARQEGAHTVLTTPADDGHNTAFNGGTLTIGSSGCVTDGRAVLVLPDDVVLRPDGSIELDGRRIRPGEALDIAGGLGPVPGDQRCGVGAYWYL